MFNHFGLKVLLWKCYLSHESCREGETSSSVAYTKAEFNELISTMKGIQQNRESMKIELSAGQKSADDCMMWLTIKCIEFKRMENEK